MKRKRTRLRLVLVDLDDHHGELVDVGRRALDGRALHAIGIERREQPERVHDELEALADARPLRLHAAPGDEVHRQIGLIRPEQLLDVALFECRTVQYSMYTVQYRTSAVVYSIQTNVQYWASYSSLNSLQYSNM